MILSPTPSKCQRIVNHEDSRLSIPRRWSDLKLARRRQMCAEVAAQFTDVTLKGLISSEFSQHTRTRNLRWTDAARRCALAEKRKKKPDLSADYRPPTIDMKVWRELMTWARVKLKKEGRFVPTKQQEAAKARLEKWNGEGPNPWGQCGQEGWISKFVEQNGREPTEDECTFGSLRPLSKMQELWDVQDRGESLDDFFEELRSKKRAKALAKKPKKRKDEDSELRERGCWFWTRGGGRRRRRGGKRWGGRGRRGGRGSRKGGGGSRR